MILDLWITFSARSPDLSSGNIHFMLNRATDHHTVMIMNMYRETELLFLHSGFLSSYGWTEKQIFQFDKNLRSIYVVYVANVFNDILCYCVQSHINSSDIFWTIEICSRPGYFKPLRVNLSARTGGKWVYFSDVVLTFYL